MYPKTAVSSLLLLSTSVNAFFPVANLGDGIRETAGSIGERFHHGPASRDVVKRGDKEEKKPGIFISIAPFRSSTRYKVRSAPAPPTRSVPLDKRENQYKIVTANAPSQPTSLAIDEDGTDYSYFSKMTIGSKDTEMYMLLDTGSAVTWVMADDCQADPCKHHNTFGSSTGSSTLKTGGSDFSLDYGSGEVSGKNANDTISFAGMKVTTPIGLAEKVSDDFQNYPFDGILGLGRVPINNQPPSTFIQEVANNKLLPANVFGINLQRNSDGSADGEINFGAPDKTKYKDDLHWVDTVQDKSFWEVPADDITVDGKSVGLNSGRSAILDTGTSYMLIPPNDAKALFDKIPGSSTSDGTNYNVPCDASTPVQVVLGGIGYTISPKDYVATNANGKRDGTCGSHIIGMAAAGDDHTWLLGDTFLKNVYSVYDADKNRIGLGAKSGSTVINKGEASASQSDSTSSASGSSASASSGSSSTASGSSSKPSVTGSSQAASGTKSGSATPAPTGTAAGDAGQDKKQSAASSVGLGGLQKALAVATVAAVSLIFM